MIKHIVMCEIKPEKVEKLKAWYQELMGKRRKEAIESLSSENVLREVGAILSVGDRFYDVGFVDFEGDLLPADPALPINQAHRAIRKECLVKPIILGEVLYDLRR